MKAGQVDRPTRYEQKMMLKPPPIKTHKKTYLLVFYGQTDALIYFNIRTCARYGIIIKFITL